jgi:hypothetical protein
MLQVHCKGLAMDGGSVCAFMMRCATGLKADLPAYVLIFTILDKLLNRSRLGPA